MNKSSSLIQIVDDEPRDARLFATLLAAEGYEVSVATSGEDCLAQLETRQPKLILLDIMMPGMDGFAVTAKLKQDERTRSIPLIIVTALNDRSSRLHALSLGADEYITKPVDRVELNLRVENMLRLRECQQILTAHNQALEQQITARTAELYQSEQTLKLTLDAANIGYWDLDLITHAASRSLRHDQIFGYSEMQPDWHYENFLAQVVAEDRARVDSLFQIGVIKKTSWEFECRIIRTDGALRWIWAHGNVFPNAAGEAARMLGMVSDISARKQAEERIHAQLNELQRWQAIMIGREDRHRQLKQEVNEMLHRLGEPPRYASLDDPEEKS